MSAPSPLDRLWQVVFRVAVPLLRVGWRLWPLPHQGALVAVSVGNSLLLVRSSYKPHWSFPGGGVKSRETPRQAAERELVEECGLALALTAEPVVVSGRWEGRPDTVFIFPITLTKKPPVQIDNREVVEARFVDRSDLSGLPLAGPVVAYCAVAIWPADHQHAGF